MAIKKRGRGRPHGLTDEDVTSEVNGVKILRKPTMRNGNRQGQRRRSFSDIKWKAVERLWRDLREDETVKLI